MADELSCRPDGSYEPAATNDVVQPALEKLEKHIAGVALAAACFNHVPAELLLKKTVVVTKFLLFGQADAIVLRPPIAVAMHPGSIELSPGCVLRDVRDRDTYAA